MSESLSFFATAPRGTESLLAAELHAVAAHSIREETAGVSFAGSLETAYRACLWSRTATRVLLKLAHFPVRDNEELYQQVHGIAWEEHLGVEGTFAVDLTSRRSPITHSHYAVLRVKDAIVDRFHARAGARPSVDTARPDVRIHVHLQGMDGTLSLDLSGESLHRRGYRQAGVAAPLKENLAAAILLKSGWTAAGAQRGGGLVDLMCGSGTLLIEGAFIAADIAPGLMRSYFGFLGWRGHDPALWSRLREEALERKAAGLERLPAIRGYDRDNRAVEAARANVAAADLGGYVRIEQRPLAQCQPEPQGEPGLVVVNPPYGERIGSADGLAALYEELGRQLKRCFPGWRAAVFTAYPQLATHLRLRSKRVHALYNGAIPCKLLHFELHAGPHQDMQSAPALGPGAQMLANRLRKNLRHLGRWANREGIDCYRIYDADLPEYALAVDVYQGEERWVHVQEYEAPKSIPPAQARQRVSDALRVIAQVLAVPRTHLFVKTRRRQKGAAQYEKLGEAARFHAVREWNCRLWVNFEDYLDTGLFLDHRFTRRMLQELTKGKTFLNLFCYTAAATVHAARGGATRTTSVDLSATYLDWARRNMALNDFAGPAHRFEQADCLEWLHVSRNERYDIIFLDPPTFSNSKRMERTLDIQRDHVALIRQAMGLLAPGGVLIFSNNFRRFQLDRQSLADLQIDDITRATLPKDFERNPRIHNCWRITFP